MSPEYAVNGLLSLKSDVFSFGVIVLEILSGIRNNHFKNQDHPHNLLGQAWILWKEGRALEFIDANMDLTSIPYEILRCLQVGLLYLLYSFDQRRKIPLSTLANLHSKY
ncbi:unnamed protein product [Trifolium pratense]|uniref:Uncharacterized protein n=1 Tax=Trifolium pratense TaxID=57577 RepID=A0ACB0JYS3_TRIPR|nr:unnamed protein product [Trifolium pratense]